MKTTIKCEYGSGCEVDAVGFLLVRSNGNKELNDEDKFLCHEHRPDAKYNGGPSDLWIFPAYLKDPKRLKNSVIAWHSLIFGMNKRGISLNG